MLAKLMLTNDAENVARDSKSRDYIKDMFLRQSDYQVRFWCDNPGFISFCPGV